MCHHIQHIQTVIWQSKYQYRKVRCVKTFTIDTCIVYIFMNLRSTVYFAFVLVLYCFHLHIFRWRVKGSKTIRLDVYVGVAQLSLSISCADALSSQKRIVSLCNKCVWEIFLCFDRNILSYKFEIVIASWHFTTTILKHSFLSRLDSFIDKTHRFYIHWFRTMQIFI